VHNNQSTADGMAGDSDDAPPDSDGNAPDPDGHELRGLLHHHQRLQRAVTGQAAARRPKNGAPVSNTLAHAAPAVTPAAALYDSDDPLASSLASQALMRSGVAPSQRTKALASLGIAGCSLAAVPTGIDPLLEGELSMHNTALERTLVAVHQRERDALFAANLTWGVSERLRTLIALFISSAHDTVSLLLRTESTQSFLRDLDTAAGVTVRTNSQVLAELVELVHSRPQPDAAPDEPTLAHIFRPFRAEDRFGAWNEWRSRLNRAFGGHPALTLLALVLEPTWHDDDAPAVAEPSTQDLCVLLVCASTEQVEQDHSLATILLDNLAQTLQARVANATRAPTIITASCSTGGECAVSAKTAHLTPPPGKSYADFVTPRSTPIPLVRMADVCPADDPRVQLARAHELSRLNDSSSGWARSDIAATVHRRKVELRALPSPGSRATNTARGRSGRGATTSDGPDQQRARPLPATAARGASGPPNNNNSRSNSGNSSNNNNNSNSNSNSNSNNNNNSSSNSSKNSDHGNKSLNRKNPNNHANGPANRPSRGRGVG
jgi:hypothetical protein